MDQVKALMKLRRWAQRQHRVYHDLYTTPGYGGAGKERAFGEMNMCRAFVARIDKELKLLEWTEKASVQG